MSKDTRLHPVDDNEKYVVEKNYILKNPQLPSRLTKINYEPWMAEEIKKCMDDILYFATEYFYIVSLDEGRIKIPLYDIQKRILKMMVNDNRVAIVSSRQMGKCLYFYTIIKIRNKFLKIPIAIKIGWLYKIARVVEKLKSFVRRKSTTNNHIEGKNKQDIALEVVQPANMVLRKFTDVISLKNWQVETENGWEDVESIAKTVPYRKYTISTDGGKSLECADNHIIITEDGEEIFAKDSLGKRIRTIDGIETVTFVADHGTEEEMFDLCMAENTSHRYYTNGILSHNTTLLTIFALFYTIFQDDKTVLLVANKQGTAREVLARIRLAYENLPVWLKPGVTEWQKESVKFANGSRIAISSTSTSAGRSFSINCLLIDECAFIPPHLSDEFFTSVLPTITSSKKSKLILTSTPNGASGYFYERVRDAMRGKSEWKYVSVPWTSIPGRDLEWYKKALSDCNNDEKFFSQEYACAFLQDGDMAFDKAYLEEMKRRTKEAPVLNTQEYKVWETPKQGHTYAMGVDVAEGVGDCASCVQVIDITDLTNIRQVACYNNRSIDPSHFAKAIFDIALQWGKPYILIERNNMGIEVVSRLEGEPFYYPKLIAYDATEREKAKRKGIMSSVQSKYDGVSNMRYYMNVMRAVDIPDAQTLTEFDTFIRWPNGTYKKANGDGIFDDRVMALCWALFILHTPIAQKYLNITEWSETGKPAKLGKPDEEQQFLGIGVFQDESKKKVVYDPLFGVGVVGESNGERTMFSVDEMDREDLERAGWRALH